MVRQRLWNLFLATLLFGLLGGFMGGATSNFMDMLRALVVLPIEGPPLIIFFAVPLVFH